MANVSSSNGIEKCPKLRFNGFSNTWTLQSAESLFENVTDKNHPEETVLTIIQGSGTLPRGESSRNIRYDESGIANYKKVQTHDYIIHLRSFEGGLEMANSTGIISPAYTVLRPKEKVAPLFYDAYFHTDEFINHILAKSVEGIRDGRQISYEAFKWLKIPTCSFEEQSKIAELFRVLAIRINKQRELVSTLKKYKRGLAKRLFEEITLMHPSVEIESLFSFIRNGFVGTVTPYFTDKNKGVRYLQGTNVHSGKITDDTEFYISKEFNEKHQKNILKPDDILVVQSGHVGECAVVGDKYAGANCHALIIMSNAGSCCSKYVAQYINSDIGIQKIAAITTGNTIKHILATTIAKVTVPVPSLDEQKRIANVLEKTDKHIDLEEQFLMHLISMRQGFLQQLFI